MPKFGVSIYSISRKFTSGELTPEQGVEWLCQNGTEVIEIVPIGFDFLDDRSLASRMKAVADKHNVPISNYSIGANFLATNRAEQIASVKAHLEIAKELGVSTFRSDCTEWQPAERNTIENFLADLPVITETYDELSEYAATLGIKLLIENHGFHANGAERVRLILKGVKSPNFGHQLDVGNYICVDDKPEASVRKMTSFATTVHMKDFYIRQSDPGDLEQWIPTPGGQYLRGAIFGQGDLDTKSIIHTVKSSGYDGNIYIEYEGLEDCLYGTKVSLDNLKRIWSEV